MPFNVSYHDPIGWARIPILYHHNYIYLDIYNYAVLCSVNIDLKIALLIVHLRKYYPRTANNVYFGECKKISF
jgi:hypothetical protein